MSRQLKEKDFFTTAFVRKSTVLYNITNVVLSSLAVYFTVSINEPFKAAYDEHIDDVDTAIGGKWGVSTGIKDDPNGVMARRYATTLFKGMIFDTNLTHTIMSYSKDLKGVLGPLQTAIIFSGAEKRLIDLERLLSVIAEIPSLQRVQIINNIISEFEKLGYKFEIKKLKPYLSELAYKIFEAWYYQMMEEQNDGIFAHPEDMEIPEISLDDIDDYFVKEHDYPKGFAILPFNSKYMGCDIDAQQKFFKLVKTNSVMRENYSCLNYPYMMSTLLILLMYRNQKDYLEYVSSQLSGIDICTGNISASSVAACTPFSDIASGRVTDFSIGERDFLKTKFPELIKPDRNTNSNFSNRPFEFCMDPVIHNAIKNACLELNDKGMFSNSTKTSTAKSIIEVKASSHKSEYIKVACGFYSFFLQYLLFNNLYVYTMLSEFIRIKDYSLDLLNDLIEVKKVNSTLNVKIENLTSEVNALKKNKPEAVMSVEDKEDYDYSKLFESMQKQLEDLENKLAKAERKNQRYQELYGNNVECSEDDEPEEPTVSLEEMEEAIRSKSIVIYTGVAIPRITEELGVDQRIVEKKDNINTMISESIKCDIIGVYTRKISHKATFRIKSIAERKGFAYINLNCTNYNRIVNAIYELIKPETTEEEA